MDKQDKMVILLGIIIIAVAVVGIAYHEQTYVASEEVESVSYKVSWRDYSDEIMEEGYVDKTEGWQNTYDITIDDPNACIYKVEVKITWSDDRDFHGIILPWNWSDAIEATVSIDEMQFSQSASGYGAIEMVAQRDRPNDFKVDTADEEEISKIIQDTGVINSINCNMDLSILAKPMFLDRGNDFTLYITYHYCIPEIVAM